MNATSIDGFSDLAIPFGLRADGLMVGAAEPSLANGLACNCICPKCKTRLIARNKGEHNRAHFAHEASPSVPGELIVDEVVPCSGAGETSIHRMAKQIIAGRFSTLLPAVTAEMPPLQPRVLHRSLTDLWHKLTNVRLEVWCEGFRPDIIGVYDGQMSDGLSRPFAVKGEGVAIEIVVTHPSGPEKVVKLQEYGLAAFEIDISRERYTATESSLGDILNEAPRKWLFHPMIDNALAKMQEDVAVMAIQVQQHGASQLTAAQMTELFPDDPEERLRIQVAGLRKYDSAAWRRYNFSDERERLVVEQLLRLPWPRSEARR